MTSTTPKRPARHPHYPSSPLWTNLVPIPLSEGPSSASATTPLASIAYSARYLDAMSYLRAVMQASEYSERALSLTADIISMNPAHYTVWLYRARIIRELNAEDGVERELRWLGEVSRQSLKNYQIWHHRQTLLSTLPQPPKDEQSFLASILALDAKNYHVWTYRQWFVSHFDLWDDEGEMAAVEGLLREDVRNNSAWNHRWFLVFGRLEKEGRRRSRGEERGGWGAGVVVVDEDLVEREIHFAQEAITQAPQNQSPWNYLRGVLRISGKPLKEVRGFAEGFLGSGEKGFWDEGVKSSHALDLLAEVYAESDREEDGREKAKVVLEALGGKWDPIRKGYWDYRIRLLGEGSTGGEPPEVVSQGVAVAV